MQSTELETTPSLSLSKKERSSSKKHLDREKENTHHHLTAHKSFDLQLNLQSLLQLPLQSIENLSTSGKTPVKAIAQSFTFGKRQPVLAPPKNLEKIHIDGIFQKIYQFTNQECIESIQLSKWLHRMYNKYRPIKPEQI